MRTARRIGYRILPGEGFSYILHLRPREWPIMAAHTTVGFVLAIGLRDLLDPDHLRRLGAALLLWVICLNGGTLAINSAFDRDTGDIGYLDAPPPVPRYLFAFGLCLMGIGQVGALAITRPFALAYAACFVLSVLYSVPPVRLKAVAGADWLINMIGFGTLTPFAGWAASGRQLETPELLVLLAFFPLFGALYPLTQLYQLAEDRARGDRTLAILLGTRPSLWIALGAVGVAYALFVAALALRTVPLARAILLLVTGALWLGFIGRWIARAEGMTPIEEKRGMYTALAIWGLTDVATLAAFAWL